MSTKKDFRIEKCDDCLRVTRTDVDGDFHTHVKSKHMAEKIIELVCGEHIPLSAHNRTLISAQRLSTNPAYIGNIQELLDVRKQKGKKQNYYNSCKKSTSNK